MRTTRKGGSYVLESSPFFKILSTPAIIVLLLLLVVPLIIILSKAFVGPEGSLTLNRVITLLKSEYTWRIVRFTFLQAFISTVVSVLIALPGAYIIANYRFRGKRLIKAISVIPFVLPSILVVLGFVIFYGNSGLINQLLMKLFNLEEGPIKILYTFGAVILAHAFYNFPIALGLISSFWEQLPISYNHAAMTLGAKKRSVFRTVTLPRLIPPILSAATLIFLFCFSSFVILLVLGGGPKFTTMEVEIYRRARMSLDLEGAATFSLISIFLTLIIVAIYIWTQRLVAHQEEIELLNEKNLEKSLKTVWGKIGVALYTLFATLFVLGPLGAIIYNSFTYTPSRSGKTVFTLRWYKQLFNIESTSSSMMSVALSAIILSLIIAAITTIVSLIFTTMLSAKLRNDKIKGSLATELFAMLPMAVSSVIIGLGYYLIASSLQLGNIGARILVILAHVVIVSPFILRSILPEYRKVSFTYSQASFTLGANVARTFWLVELPLLRSALITGGAFAFAISLGEINATLVLADSSLVTIPIVMYRLIGSYNFAGAAALGSVLIVLCAIIFFLTELAKKRSN